MSDVDRREALLEEVQALCKKLEIDFAETSEELLKSLGTEQVVDYHLVQGPFPMFQKTLAECFILTPQVLLDLEIQQKGKLWHMVPLSNIVGILEEFTEFQGEDFLTVAFRYSGQIALVIQEKMSARQELRRFARMVGAKWMAH